MDTQWRGHKALAYLVRSVVCPRAGLSYFGGCGRPGAGRGRRGGRLGGVATVMVANRRRYAGSQRSHHGRFRLATVWMGFLGRLDRHCVRIAW